MSLTAQRLDQVHLGTVKGELQYFHGSLTWVNDFSDSVSGNIWSEKGWLTLSDRTFRVGPGDTLSFDYNILLAEVVGEQQSEIRLLDDQQIVLHGFLVQGRFQAADTMALNSYRNEFFPFKSKEQVFNIGAAFTGQTLAKEFVLYNFGGDSLNLSKITSEDEALQFKFNPPMIGHNQFTRMEISLLPNANHLGFTRKNVKLWDDEEHLIAVLPVLYTIESGASRQNAVIVIDKINHDFKVVKKGDSREALVTISNVGSDELVISKLESNCGCLTYDISDRAIAPGASIRLNVKFDATQRIGYERKTLAIFSNDPKQPTRVLVFRAHVK